MGTVLVSDGQRIAAAMAKWLASEEGKTCQDGSASSEFLRNRLRAAFIAGWEMGQADARSKRLKGFSELK